MHKWADGVVNGTTCTADIQESLDVNHAYTRTGFIVKHVHVLVEHTTSIQLGTKRLIAALVKLRYGAVNSSVIVSASVRGTPLRAPGSNGLVVCTVVRKVLLGRFRSSPGKIWQTEGGAPRRSDRCHERGRGRELDDHRLWTKMHQTDTYRGSE